MRAFLTTSWNYGGGNVNAIPFNSVSFDTNSAYNTTTGKFQPTIAGYYHVIGRLYFSGGSSGHDARILKNGITSITTQNASVTYNISSESSATVTDIVYLNGTTDYIQIATFGSLATVVAGDSGGTLTSFTCALTS